MTKRPNFLLFITDQHRADHLGCYGNEIVRTPNIDGIASNGTRFDRFYVANPICMPNRASLMTGRMPSLHGVRHNGIPLSTEDVTFVELLRAAGYRTGLVGKSHLQNFTGTPPMQKFQAAEGKAAPPEELRQARRHHRSGRAYENENPRLWDGDPGHEVLTPFYGFDHVRLATEHGDLCGGHYLRWLGERHPDPKSLRGAENALPDNRYQSPQAWRTRVPEDLYPTSFIRDMALDYLDAHARSSAGSPFFLQVSFPDPHHPFTPPGRYWDMYDPDRIPLPESFGKGETPILKWLHEALERGEAVRTSQDAFAVTEREAREIIALTYGMITMIDDAVGAILDRLRRRGLADDTVVIFTADHGDYMGDHSIMLKMLQHYHGLIRVPFLWADPAAQERGRTSKSLAQTIDIPATILARAGVQPYHGIQGRDLADARAPAPDGLVIEEDASRPMLGVKPPYRVRTYVTDRWRLTLHYDGGWAELYDLERDPHETRNLWDDRGHREVRAELTERMLKRMITLQDLAPLPTGRA